MRLIDQQAAIDAIDKFNVCGYVEEPYEKLRDALQALPAAVSDFITCADCRHAGNRIADGRYWCKYHEDYMRYCSDAERRQ